MQSRVILNPMYRKFFIALLLLGGFLCLSVTLQAQVSMDAKEITLKGWQYRWGDSPLNAQKIPHWIIENTDHPNWMSFELPGQPPEREDREFVWLRVKLPQNQWKDPVLYFFSISQSFEVYLENQKIYHFGDVSKGEKGRPLGWKRGYVIPLNEFDEKTLYFRIYSNYSRIGIDGNVFLGSRADYILGVLEREIDRVVLGVFIIVIGIFPLLIFFRKRERKAYLWFGVFAFSTGFYMITRTHSRELIYDAPGFWAFAELASVFIIPIGFTGLIQNIFGLKQQSVVHLLWQLHLAYAIFALSLAGIGVISPSATIIPFNILALITAAFSLVTIATIAFKGDTEAKIFTLGMFCILVTGTYDALVVLNVFPWSRLMIHWGLFFFVLFLGWILIHRFDEAIKAMKEGKRLELELQTASLVQNLFIPKEDPKLEAIEVASFYKSASETGGDWYDFRYRPESEQLDVLIADVTGHGVQAALVTAMVTSFYQAMETHRIKEELSEKENSVLLHPSHLMEQLNDVLYATMEGFHTMTFCHSIIDLKHKTLTYSSAAHPPCCIWRPKGFVIKRRKKEKRCNIISLMNCNHILGERPSSTYKIKTQEVQRDDVIVWYTDGLIENENDKEEMFGMRTLRRILQSSNDLSAQEIKDRIVDAAYQHYGNVPQEDDVTLVVARIR